MTGAGTRLAIFMPSFRGGGAERVMVTLARGFVARGARVDLVVAQQEGPNLPEATEGLRVVDLKSRRVVLATPRLVRYLRRESPDVVLSALPHANVVAVWARAMAASSTRLVVSEHTTASLSAANSPRLRARLLPRLMGPAYRRADAIVAVSDGVGDDLAALTGIERARISRIYNPVVTPALQELAIRPLEHPWFRPGEPPVILAAGRLTAAKDFATLVRAFSLLRRSRRARLVILGEGEERRRLQALAEELEVAADVELPGFVDNPYHYMKQAGVFVLSSRWEGFGMALVEAMACGTAVVSTDCPHGPREILEGGRHGALVPTGMPDAMSRAIEDQLDRPAPPSALERAGEFSSALALDRYAAILRL